MSALIHILIVEDDEQIQFLLCSFLEEHGFSVRQAFDGLSALTHVQNADLILLDVMLPQLDGLSVLAHIRETSDVPVILLTALGSERDQLAGFDGGADDYIVKPFSVPLLLRKIEVALRRANKMQKNRIIYRNLEIDTEGMQALIDGVDCKLTTKEFAILLELFTHQGIVLSRDVLVTKVWGDETFCDDRIVNIHIKNIRAKLGVDYIQTVRGAGYKVEKNL